VARRDSAIVAAFTLAYRPSGRSRCVKAANCTEANAEPGEARSLVSTRKPNRFACEERLAKRVEPRELPRS